MESPYSILDELNIKYQKVNCLSSGYNIKIENNIAKVICIDNDDLIDGTNGYSDEVIKDKNDTFIIIKITFKKKLHNIFYKAISI